MNKKTRKKVTSPDDIVLDPYEQELENSLDVSLLKDSLSAEDKDAWAEVAKRHLALQRSKRITLSVNTGELLRFRAKAKSKGISYQTLMNVIIKQYNDDEISIGL